MVYTAQAEPHVASMTQAAQHADTGTSCVTQSHDASSRCVAVHQSKLWGYWAGARAWMTKVLPEMPPMWNALSSSRVANTVPRPVAASRPYEPCRCTGCAARCKLVVLWCSTK